MQKIPSEIIRGALFAVGRGRMRRAFEVYLAVEVLYFIIIYMVSLLSRLVERKFGAAQNQ